MILGFSRQEQLQMGRRYPEREFDADQEKRCVLSLTFPL